MAIRGLISDFFDTWLGRFVLGIILLAIAPLLFALLAPINIPNTTITMPDNSTITVPAGTIWGIVKAFLPIMIVVTALYYLGVRF